MRSYNAYAQIMAPELTEALKTALEEFGVEEDLGPARSHADETDPNMRVFHLDWCAYLAAGEYEEEYAARLWALVKEAAGAVKISMNLRLVDIDNAPFEDFEFGKEDQ